jgi:hypothetical protein
MAFSFGCGAYQRPDEREATQVIQALSAGNLDSVRGRIAPSVHVSQAQIDAVYYDLRKQGHLLYVHQYTVECPNTWECFNVGFERRYYILTVSHDKSGKIDAWWLNPLKASPAPQ